MRIISEKVVFENVYKMIKDASYYAPSDYIKILKDIKTKETSDTGIQVMDDIVKNNEIASRKNVPICQDTGIVVVFIEVGQKVYLDFDIYSVINSAVAKAYEDFYLRKSVVRHPLDRVNTKNNTPAIIHTKLVPGDNLKIKVCPKGAGSENMSALTMLKPADGEQGVVDFVVDVIKKGGMNACPPLIIGVGIGGNFEKVAGLAKEALIEPIEKPSDDPINAKLEVKLLEKINELGIGPMGLGGNTTAIAVKVKSYPCHIAALPVAVNIQCHANRHEEIVL